MLSFDERVKHPTPQNIRESWWLLNGEWDFQFDKNNVGVKEKWFLNKPFDKKIIVPFSYTSKLSGIKSDEYISNIWYKKEVNLEIKSNKKYLLHFQASDYKTEVWVNGLYVGKNEGGFFQFTFNITDYINMGKNTIVVRVEDNNKTYQHLGKQSYKDVNFLCWYTKTIGIWQDVWLEEVGETYLAHYKMTPNLEKATLDIEANLNKSSNLFLKTTIYFKDKVISENINRFIEGKTQQTNYISSRFADFRLYYWSPDSPNLYDIKLEILNEKGEILDKIYSYFGMRKISTSNGFVCINNQKLFHKMILDQGYFGEGLMTPRTTGDLIEDVKKIKEMGFNGVRKHQKLEDVRFQFLCDYYGLLMWAEMPSFYEYSSLSQKEMIKNIDKFIERHYNSPSVETYVLFNESWGLNRIMDDKQIQAFVDGMFYLTKSLDNTRLVIGNDGWEHTKTDILTIHDYSSFEENINKIYKNKENIIKGAPSQTSNRDVFVTGYSYNNEPIFISEYGGVAFETETSKNFNTWGYGERITNPNEVLEKIALLTQAFINNDNISGICYTQLSDVEQEINGLLDHNHNYKFNVNDIKKVLNTNKEGGFRFE